MLSDLHLLENTFCEYFRQKKTNFGRKTEGTALKRNKDPQKQKQKQGNLLCRIENVRVHLAYTGNKIKPID